MGKQKKWSEEDIEYLMEEWGNVRIETIAKKLNRSVNAIRLKVHKLGLGSSIKASSYIAAYELSKALNVNYNTVLTWERKYNLPVKYKSFSKKAKIRMIDIEDFWKWAYNNRKLIDFSIIEKNVLGCEPSWVELQRKIDKNNYTKKNIGGRARKWTKQEEDKLLELVKTYKYTYKDIAKMLNRSENSIQNKLREMGVYYRPLRAECSFWTQEELNIAIELYKIGYSYDYISDKINKTAKAVKMKLYRHFINEETNVAV